jgi:pyruvate, water dikinase
VILELGDIRAADAPRVGPKMARLGQLAAAGWRVPDGYAVTAEALSDWLPPPARAELDGLLGALASGQTAGAPGAPGAPGGPGVLTGVMARARALVESQPLPAALADAVAAAHDRLERRVRAVGGAVNADGDGALRVAVRSSAVSEDGTGASFAGQYETYLGVSGVPDVLSHIRKCWASGYSAHALEYRRRHGAGGGSPHEHDLAVGVLELVDVRSAGVVFTLDPITGDRNTLVVEANWGFGESVVSGQVSPDHWTVDRATGDILTRRTGDKHVWSVFSPAAGRVVLEPAPPDRSARACLTDDEVRYLARQAMRIEDAEGGAPQDVEWAIARGLPFPDSVFILQHRPETTWAGGPPPDAEAEPPAAAGFDPVRYALRNVFRVPGA